MKMIMEYCWNDADRESNPVLRCERAASNNLSHNKTLLEKKKNSRNFI